MTGFAEDSDYKDNRISQPFITSNILSSPKKGRVPSNENNNGAIYSALDISS